MSFASYADLKTRVASWAWREDLAADVDDVIDLAETRINRDLRVAQMETQDTLTLTAGVATLPADYLEYREVWTEGASGRSLQSGSPAELRRRYNETSGIPSRFAIIGSELHVYPRSTGTVGLTYYAKIPALSDSQTTNWLLASAPDVYLYACQLEIAHLSREDERMGTWGQLYDNAIKALQRQDKGARWAHGSARTPGPTP